MHTGKRFKIRQVLLWTRRELFLFTLIATVPTWAYVFLKWHWLGIPWLPVSLVGTAVAFLIGFKNNASYARLWEARQIWGAIVNASRSWGVMARDYLTLPPAQESVSNADLAQIQQTLIYRHIAWLTALRFQLRQPKAWENLEKPHAKEYRKYYSVPEWESKLEEQLKPFLSPTELEVVLSKKNQATYLLSLQSKHLKELRAQGLIEAYPYTNLENMIGELFTQQGKSERIKNFPYPRQFSTFNLYFVWLFIGLIPLGMLEEISHKMEKPFIWLTIPFTVLIAWVFHTMEKIGEATENPFEGGANDIPMAAMCRTIEIDLREMLNETQLPPALQAVNDILM
jgi:ion channel-forming bestrophin family protein